MDDGLNPYMSLLHVGWEWGLSNRVLGRALDEADYRTPLGTPSAKAVAEGLAIQRPNSSYGWHRDLVGDFIQQRGLSRRSEPMRKQMFMTELIEFR